MDFKEIGSGISSAVGRIANRFGNFAYSPLAPAAMEDAYKVHQHALRGEHYTPTIGVDGTFDPDSDEGQEIIAQAEQKFRNAKATHLKAFRHTPGMLHPDEVLGIDDGHDAGHEDRDHDGEALLM